MSLFGFRSVDDELIKELIAQHARQTKVIGEMVDTFKRMDHFARSLHARLATIEQILINHDMAVRPSEERRH